VGNEEIGETEPMGTPHVLELLREAGNVPQLLIAGERTGESGNEMWGEICVENRGVMRFEIVAQGQKGHTGIAAQDKEVSIKLLEARIGITHLLENHLTLSGLNAWRSQVNFPFIEVGQPGVYNISPDIGRLGVEIRPIPQDDLDNLYADLQSYCESNDLELLVSVKENGIACDPKNEYLLALIQAVRQASQIEPTIGKKLPGTSARFAPHGQGVVWGQSGLGPHANDERHYVPSIMPYYNALIEFAQVLQAN
jgi:acetylornithine deacetylase/succinyl-diaminopimelate desuccinylase-like protein